MNTCTSESSGGATLSESSGGATLSESSGGATLSESSGGTITTPMDVEALLKEYTRHDLVTILFGNPQHPIVAMNITAVPLYEALNSLSSTLMTKKHVPHPTDECYIFKYTDLMGARKIWTIAAGLGRGIMINMTTGAISMPLPKFFSPEQLGSLLDLDQPYKVWRKYDGSCIVVFNGIVSTLGSATSTQAKAAMKFLKSKIGFLDFDTTYVFEYLDPTDQKIEVSSQQTSVVLLHAIDATGMYLDIAAIGETVGLEYATCRTMSGQEVLDQIGLMDQLVRDTGKITYIFEGLVIQGPGRIMYKIKTWLWKLLSELPRISSDSQFYSKLKSFIPKKTRCTEACLIHAKAAFMDTVSSAFDKMRMTVTDDDRVIMTAIVAQEYDDSADKFMSSAQIKFDCFKTMLSDAGITDESFDLKIHGRILGKNMGMMKYARSIGGIEKLTVLDFV